MGQVASAISNIPTDMECGYVQCSVCNAVILQAALSGYFTDIWQVTRPQDGKLRRQFIITRTGSLCGCTQEIWVSDDDAPMTHPLFDNVRTASDILSEWTKGLNKMGELLKRFNNSQ